MLLMLDYIMCIVNRQGCLCNKRQFIRIRNFQLSYIFHFACSLVRARRTITSCASIAWLKFRRSPLITQNLLDRNVKISPGGKLMRQLHIFIVNKLAW